MLYKTDIGDQSSQFNIDNSSTIYTLAAGDSITSSQNGIDETSHWHQNTIQIDGSITAMSPGKMAILTEGSETKIIIGESGVVNGVYGIYAYGDHTNVINNGSIVGSNYAVGFGFSDHSRFVNNGTVTGGFIVDRSDDMTITLNEGSAIENLSGSAFSIASDAGQKAHIVNHGELTASNWGVYMRDGDETFVNRGTISGGISLGGGNDVFDNRGGSVDEHIDGDDGNDVFVIDKKIELVEYDGGGIDTVKSTISMNLSTGVLLGQELENLTLLGGKNTSATGNELANIILGNTGNNRLFGLSGADSLKGGKGNDRLDGGLDADSLSGGKGADTFVFKTGHGDDTVTDFQNGADHFDLKSWTAIEDFADLKAHHLTVSGDDLIIHAGSDTLTISGTAKSELDAGDFLF